MVKKKAIQEE